MNKHGSDFELGRSRLKIFVFGAIIPAIASLFFKGTAQSVLTAITLVLFAAAIWTLFKYCRCPHCGKLIFMGVLAIRVCPRCRYDLITGKKAKKAK